MKSRLAMACVDAETRRLAMQDGISVVFRAVGDICPGDKEILGLGVCSATRKHGLSFPFAGLAGVLDGADILVGNLEGVLSRRMDSLVRPDITFCGESGFARELRRVGFTALTMANNHVFEHGEAYFTETIELLGDAGIDVLGLRDPSGQFYCKPVISTVRGLRVGILAYNWVSVDRLPAAGDFIAQIHDSAVNYTWDRDSKRDRARRIRGAECNADVHADIRKLRPSVDHVVVIPHWGFEFVHLPPFGCILEGRSFVEAGADVVVGVHPHVVQGYECYSHGAVFYSLGNFLFDQRDRACRRGMVLTYELGGLGHGKCRLDYTSQSTSCRLAKAAPRTAALVTRVVASSSAAIASPEGEKTLDDDKVYAAFERRYRLRKLRIIATHFYLSLRHPFIARVVMSKVEGLAQLILRRLQGERTRW